MASSTRGSNGVVALLSRYIGSVSIALFFSIYCLFYKQLKEIISFEFHAKLIKKAYLD
ncbi:hypothetical protein GCM10027443_02120 [Pontibacter brevis]